MNSVLPFRKTIQGGLQSFLFPLCYFLPQIFRVFFIRHSYLLDWRLILSVQNYSILFRAKTYPHPLVDFRVKEFLKKVLWYTTHMQKMAPSDAASKELLHDLHLVNIESSADRITRILYSTDASIYQIMPVGVAWPKDKDQVIGAVELAVKHGIPVLPRGGGSSLAGQAIGNALILDFSRYMDQILDINLEEQTVTVQPGVVLGPLNRRLKDHGLIFGPDPASADRATLGGVLGNNGTGAHSILYGMAHDHLLNADAVLSDGSLMTFQEVSQKDLISKQKNISRESLILGALQSILDKYQTNIKQDYPKTFRNVAGYNLKALSERHNLNPVLLLAGSEGTLGLITSAKLNLVPLPAFTSLYLIHFSDLQSALESVPSILETSPSAIELIDQMLIQLARANPAYGFLLEPIQGNPAAVLAVEYHGNEPGEITGKESGLSRYGMTVSILDQEEQQNFWKARKVGLGILQSQRGDVKATTFIEDAAVPVEYLASYATGIKNFAAEIGIAEIAFYAHASAGCLHIRPRVNLKNVNGIKQMRLLAEKSLELVLKYGGTTSGEHGEGIARGEFMERLYGPQLSDAFRQVKEAFDPDYLLTRAESSAPHEWTAMICFVMEPNTRQNSNPKELFSASPSIRDLTGLWKCATAPGYAGSSKEV